MIKIHTDDGTTHSIDLHDEHTARRWLERLGNHGFQHSIRGLSVVESHTTRGRCRECGLKSKCQACNGKVGGAIRVQYSISRPVGFASTQYDVEAIPQDGEWPGGSRATVYADDVMVSLTAHKSQPSVRVTISKVGLRRYRP